MQLSHTRPVVSATFDEPNLVSAAGLVPLMALAGKAGLRELADERVSVPTDKGANAGQKLSSLVAGMAAGADSIEVLGDGRGSHPVDGMPSVSWASVTQAGGMGKVSASRLNRVIVLPRPPGNQYQPCWRRQP